MPLLALGVSYRATSVDLLEPLVDLIEPLVYRHCQRVEFLFGQHVVNVAASFG